MVAGKVAMVTGAARGLGKSLSEALLSKGNKVAMCDVDVDVGRLSCNELASKYGEDNAKFYPCDVTNTNQFEGCINSTFKDLGRMNLLVNAAGVCDETDEGWANTIDVSLGGTVRGSRLGWKYMGLSGGGRGGTVVNISSIVALKTINKAAPVYSSVKAAIWNYTVSLGQEIFLENEGVKFITIMPGVTGETDFLDVMMKKSMNQTTTHLLKSFVKNYPPQRLSHLVEEMMNLLQSAPNGSAWLIKSNEPAFQIPPQILLK